MYESHCSKNKTHTHTQNKASPKVINPQKWTSSRMNQMIAQKNSNNDIKYI